jgi:hypothetical protein
VCGDAGEFRKGWGGNGGELMESHARGKRGAKVALLDPPIALAIHLHDSYTSLRWAIAMSIVRQPIIGETLQCNVSTSGLLHENLTD